MRGLASLGDKRSVRRDAILRNFEVAWQGPEPPELSRFLPPGGSIPPGMLAELVHIDLDFRLRRGEPARLEPYLEHYLPVEPDHATLLDLIAAEYHLRRCWEAEPDLEEYFRRFPAHADDLRNQFGITRPSTGRPAGISPAPNPDELRPAVPGYEVLRELGRGGMGIVYEARQPALGRVVALKTLLPGCGAAPEEIARFRREAEDIARLDHPHIVPIYEIGEHGGRPYFCMKAYPGGSLATRIADCGPRAVGPRREGDPHSEAARLVEAVARAVHHAHQRGVLHRDLKPSNILLDESGQPHVADFGLAKRFDPVAGVTLGSGTVGTPSYIAPEQARGNRAVTTAGDIYGLGAVLYELLTGEPPFRADTALATLLQVVEDPPPRPSLRNPRVPADLETICLKCLEKEPSRRYASALDLAEDLGRWRNGETIRARPATPGERAWRWTRRHPVVAALGLITGLALLLAVATLAVSHARIAIEQEETARALERQRQALRREQRLLYLERVALASRLWSSNQLALAERLLDECPPAFRGWEWRFLNSIRRPYRESWFQGEPITALAYDPRGRYLATAGASGAVALRDAATGRAIPCPIHHGYAVIGLAFHPDGSQLATADRDAVKVWDVATGEERFRLPGRFWMAYSRDGQYLASADGDVVKVWDARTGQERFTFSASVKLVRHGAFSPDGLFLATGGFEGWGANDLGDGGGAVQLWDVTTGQPAGDPRRYGRPVHSLAYTPDGRHLLVGQATGILQTDSGTGRVQGRIEASLNYRARLVVSPDGRYLAYAASDGTVRAWDLRLWREVFPLRGHAGDVVGLAFHPDGRRLASGGQDRAVKLWHLDRTPEVRALASSGTVTGRLAFHPGADRLALAPHRSHQPTKEEEVARVLDTTTGREVLQVRGCNDVVYDPEGRWLATGTPEGAVTIWDAETGRETRTLRGGAPTGHRLAVSLDGRRLATGGWDGAIEIWDPATGRLVGSWRGHDGRIEALSLNPDGTLLASAGSGDGVHLWSAATGARIRHFEPSFHFDTAAISPDGRLLAAAGVDRIIHLWVLATGRPAGTLHGHLDRVWQVVFSPDGHRLLSGGADGTARLWDVPSGRELLALPGVAKDASSVAFSRNGRQIAAADPHVKLWEAATDQRVALDAAGAVPLGHEGRPRSP
jgi:WD40 repeat protein